MDAVESAGAGESPRVSHRSGVSIVTVEGKLACHRSQVWETLERLDGPIVIDCAQVVDADGDALAALAELRTTGSALTLRRVPERLRRLLDEHDLADLVAYAERETNRRSRRNTT
jgi:ABC-type transporter Mla MlaB component